MKKPNSEDHIIDEYRQLSGLSYGECIFRFMCLIEKQPTYGVHFYEVKVSLFLFPISIIMNN